MTLARSSVEDLLSKGERIDGPGTIVDD